MQLTHTHRYINNNLSQDLEAVKYNTLLVKVEGLLTLQIHFMSLWKKNNGFPLFSTFKGIFYTG